MAEEIRSCPHCGGEAWVESTDSWNDSLHHPEETYGKFYVRCKGACLRLASRENAVAAWNRRATAEAVKPDPERIAQLIAHRACGGNEHDAMAKIHGYCVVCLVPWPCEYAGPLPTAGGR